MGVTPSNASADSEFLAPDLESIQSGDKVGTRDAAIAVAGSVEGAINALKLEDGVAVAGGHDGCMRHANSPELLLLTGLQMYPDCVDLLTKGAYAEVMHPAIQPLLCVKQLLGSTM